ncbi:MAG TPA: hypothetical protein VG271_13720 [Beijerinckiaceae bacterium]|nr:hypothetical protein [Beijerinckiaceae bacterium]
MALKDLNRMIELDPDCHAYSMRGRLLHKMKDYARAADDFTRARDLDEDGWRTSFGPHFRADSMARLGRLHEALADCAFIPQDHWMPGVFGLPPGNKQDFIDAIKRRAEEARRR